MNKVLQSLTAAEPLRKVDFTYLESLADQHYINITKHPTADLYLCSYTAKAQYDAFWNDYTLSCRGLIVDSQGDIKARPFPKFFNLGAEVKIEDLPNEPFRVYDKLDGSLGILYWLDGVPQLATRNSFAGEQAQRATALLHQKYFQATAQLNPAYTYLFEIIYPENRIVLDYGSTEELFLLAILDTATGNELALEDLGFPRVASVPGITTFDRLEELAQENKEGFVVRFESGFRVKVKFAEYIRLHRIITGLSELAIWEYLSRGEDLETLLSKVPDEVYAWVRTAVEEKKASFDTIEQASREVYQELPTRKETALYFQQQKYPAVLFAMLNGKDYAPIIWKMLRPSGSTTYFNDKTT